MRVTRCVATQTIIATRPRRREGTMSTTAGDRQHQRDGTEMSTFVRVEEAPSLPRAELDEHGLGSDVAYELITNELLLDGSAKLNLATFVTTKMPLLGARLMADTADKNMIDKDEYPQTA